MINTHRLDDIELVEKWDGPGGYRGRAVVIGAGVMGKDLYEKVWAADQDVVAGECPVSKPTPPFNIPPLNTDAHAHRQSASLVATSREVAKAPFPVSTVSVCKPPY